jgi:hypothetical protein
MHQTEFEGQLASQGNDFIMKTPHNIFEFSFVIFILCIQYRIGIDQKQDGKLWYTI